MATTNNDGAPDRRVGDGEKADTDPLLEVVAEENEKLQDALGQVNRGDPGALGEAIEAADAIDAAMTELRGDDTS